MMSRAKIDHVLRAEGAVTGLNQFVLIGAAAIFAWREDVPGELAMTRDVDLFAQDATDDAGAAAAFELDGSLGRDSDFDNTFGYYCDGVESQTAILPSDWKTRARQYQSASTNGVSALVPHPDDIAVSKLCAGRDKDLEWLAVASRHDLVNLELLATRFEKLPAGCLVGGAETLRHRLQIVRSRLR